MLAATSRKKSPGSVGLSILRIALTEADNLKAREHTANIDLTRGAARS
jgi:hypothetical protein